MTTENPPYTPEAVDLAEGRLNDAYLSGRIAADVWRKGLDQLAAARDAIGTDRDSL